jgi:hypothetical protein
MRHRRGLKLVALVPALAALFFIVSLHLPQQNTHLNAVLDDLLAQYLDQLPISGAVPESLASLNTPLSPRDFQVPRKFLSQACASLRAKKVLLVGPETTYYLHDLWLSALETKEHRTHDCPGPEFCNFHHICLPPDYPTPQDRFKPPPKKTELIASDSALMRYVLSTSLYTSKDKTDAGYVQAVVDPTTGIRLKNACWLYKARQADVILMNRGPVPAPAWTFEIHAKLGNWSFAAELPRHLGPGKTLAQDIVNAAFHVTAKRFVPEVLHSLRTLQIDPSMEGKILAWHASWFYGFLDFDISHSTRKVDDPWALYYNAQGKSLYIV